MEFGEKMIGTIKELIGPGLSRTRLSRGGLPNSGVKEFGRKPQAHIRQCSGENGIDFKLFSFNDIYLVNEEIDYSCMNTI